MQRRVLPVAVLGALLLSLTGCQNGTSQTHQIELAPPPEEFGRPPRPLANEGGPSTAPRPETSTKPRLKQIRPVAPDDPAPMPGAKTPTLSQAMTDPSASNNPRAQASASPPPGYAPGVHSPGTPRTVYRIRKGDTFWSIASRKLGNGKRWRELAALNPRVNHRSLRVGQPIYIPVK